MQKSLMAIQLFCVTLAASALVACSSSEQSGQNDAAASTSAPAATATANGADNEANNAASEIQAPAGRYTLDPNHASLAFGVNHLGLSNYVVRFSKHDATLELDPDNLGNSTITVTVDPTSVNTLYAGDYKESHAESRFDSWNEDLAQSEKFFNASKYPEIKFVSTQIEETAPGKLKVTGDLALLGQTHPITLDAQLVGATANHPAYEDVAGAIGFSATGEFKRSTFGMDYLVNPPLLGDTVSVNFDGEFQQAQKP